MGLKEVNDLVQWKRNKCNIQLTTFIHTQKVNPLGSSFTHQIYFEN